MLELVLARHEGCNFDHEAGMVAVKMIGAGLFLSRIGLSLSLGSG